MMKGVTSFIATWKSVLTAAQRRSIQDEIYKEKQQMILLAMQTDAVETLRERENYRQCSKMGYFSTYPTASQTGNRANRLNRKRHKGLKKCEKLDLISR